MNIIPWRRHESPSTLDSENLWNRFWGSGNREFMSHLPEVFRDRALPAINIAETEDDFCISMDCPGLDEEDFRVERHGQPNPHLG